MSPNGQNSKSKVAFHSKWTVDAYDDAEWRNELVLVLIPCIIVHSRHELHDNAKLRLLQMQTEKCSTLYANRIATRPINVMLSAETRSDCISSTFVISSASTMVGPEMAKWKTCLHASQHR